MAELTNNEGTGVIGASIRDLTPDEYAGLKEDIAKNGILVPIVVDEAGEIIDGFARKRIYDELAAEGMELGECPSETRSGLMDDGKAHLRIALNAHRRHLTREERSELLRQELILNAAASDRVIAQKIGVAKATVGKVRRGMEDAGEVVKMTTCQGADGKTYHRSFEAEPETDEPIDAVIIPDCDIRTGDFRDVLLDLHDVDLILTDPPYSDVELFGDLGAFASRVLKPSGMLLCYTGGFHLNQVMSRLDQHLDYIWMVAVTQPRPSPPIFRRHVSSLWTPVLVYCKPPYADPPFTDLIHGTGAESIFHTWQKPVAEALTMIDIWSRPGDLVVDPMTCTGTTAVATCLKHRRFVGAEIDERMAAFATQRVADQMKLAA